MTYQDKILTCSDCSQSFAFTAGEQEFYANKGYTNEPRRCPTCRANRRTERGGSQGGFGGGARQMYQAVCAQCGKDATVPFQPRGDKPVYCSDCYSRQAPTRSNYGSGSRRF